MEHRDIRLKLGNIEENQAAIHKQLQEQQNWNAQFGNTLNTVLQNQEQTYQHWDRLWGLPQFRPPY
jgi:hypothetical protein